LFDLDLQSAQLAFVAYSRVMARVPSNKVGLKTHLAELFHHAKTYVCAMRRVARMLEAMYSTRAKMPESLAQAVKLAWRKHKAKLDQFTDPRNAIEHIDSECADSTTYNMINLENNTLLVTDHPDKSIEIEGADLRRVLKVRQEIIASLNEPTKKGS
jgi:hypothetical protein